MRPGPDIPARNPCRSNTPARRPPVLVERTDLSAQAIAVFVRTGVLSMPPFRKTEVSDAELTALTAYITSVAKKR